MRHLTEPDQAGSTSPLGTGGDPEAVAHLPPGPLRVVGTRCYLGESGPRVHLRGEAGHQLAPLARMLGDSNWRVNQAESTG